MDATTKLLHKNWDYLGWKNFDDGWGDQDKWNNTLLSVINESGADIFKEMGIGGMDVSGKTIHFNSSLEVIFSTIDGYDSFDGILADRFTVNHDETIVGDKVFVEIDDYYVEIDIING